MTDLNDIEEIPGVQWIVDYSFDPPQRRCLIDYDVNTLMAFVDIADAATYAKGARTRENAAAFRNYYLNIIRELESRSLIDHQQFRATEHLAASE